MLIASSKTPEYGFLWDFIAAQLTLNVSIESSVSPQKLACYCADQKTIAKNCAAVGVSVKDLQTLVQWVVDGTYVSGLSECVVQDCKAYSLWLSSWERFAISDDQDVEVRVRAVLGRYIAPAELDFEHRVGLCNRIICEHRLGLTRKDKAKHGNSNSCSLM